MKKSILVPAALAAVLFAADSLAAPQDPNSGPAVAKAPNRAEALALAMAD